MDLDMHIQSPAERVLFAALAVLPPVLVVLDCLGVL